ncbi:hypothetical protein DMENIID0001_119590 [Sergentomyia squamirostris]
MPVSPGEVKEKEPHLCAHTGTLSLSGFTWYEVPVAQMSTVVALVQEVYWDEEGGGGLRRCDNAISDMVAGSNWIHGSHERIVKAHRD